MDGQSTQTMEPHHLGNSTQGGARSDTWRETDLLHRDPPCDVIEDLHNQAFVEQQRSIPPQTGNTYDDYDQPATLTLGQGTMQLYDSSSEYPEAGWSAYTSPPLPNTGFNTNMASIVPSTAEYNEQVKSVNPHYTPSQVVYDDMPETAWQARAQQPYHPTPADLIDPALSTLLPNDTVQPETLHQQDASLFQPFVSPLEELGDPHQLPLLCDDHVEQGNSLFGHLAVNHSVDLPQQPSEQQLLCAYHGSIEDARWIQDSPLDVTCIPANNNARSESLPPFLDRFAFTDQGADETLTETYTSGGARQPLRISAIGCMGTDIGTNIDNDTDTTASAAPRLQMPLPSYNTDFSRVSHAHNSMRGGYECGPFEGPPQSTDPPILPVVSAAYETPTDAHTTEFGVAGSHCSKIPAPPKCQESFAWELSHCSSYDLSKYSAEDRGVYKGGRKLVTDYPGSTGRRSITRGGINPTAFNSALAHLCLNNLGRSRSSWDCIPAELTASLRPVIALRSPEQREALTRHTNVINEVLARTRAIVDEHLAQRQAEAANQGVSSRVFRSIYLSKHAVAELDMGKSTQDLLDRWKKEEESALGRKVYVSPA